MKTTLELPDELFRQAKATAAGSGVSLKNFITEALQSKLATYSTTASKPWMRHFGSLRHLRSERSLIETRVAEEFESISEKEWK
jgi:hypothetical protein